MAKGRIIKKVVGGITRSGLLTTIPVIGNVVSKAANTIMDAKHKQPIIDSTPVYDVRIGSQPINQPLKAPFNMKDFIIKNKLAVILTSIGTAVTIAVILIVKNKKPRYAKR